MIPRGTTTIIIMSFPVVLPTINEMSCKMVEICEQSNRLLPQQREALQKLRSWFGGEQRNDNIALVCMPTGSGKTGIIAGLPYYLASIGLDGQPIKQTTEDPRYRFDKPVLVVAPDLAIRDQLVDELTLLTPTEPFLMRTGIVPTERCDVLPQATKIDTTDELRNQQMLKSFDLVITNAQKFRGEDWTEDLDSDLFRLVIVDEAHHHPATTWRLIIDKFRNTECPVVFLTATPFRTDKQQVLGLQGGGIAYHLSLENAVERRIIRQTHFEEVDGESAVPKLKNPAAYKEDNIRSAGYMVAILEKVRMLLHYKRENFGDVPHMAIAICRDTEQADLLLELWKECFPEESAECYYSQKPTNEKELIMGKLKNNELSLVIIVAMLLEGFDHPPISIAAITYEIKSPVRFVQFVGRAQRIYRREGYTEPQELGAHIVTHKRYKQGANYKKFTSEAFTFPLQGDYCFSV